MVRLGPWTWEVTPASYGIPVYCTTTDDTSSYQGEAGAEGSLNRSHTVHVYSVLLPWAKVTPLSTPASQLDPDMFKAE